MDSRTAAHALTRIGDLLELSGADKFRARAYRTAAAAVLALDADDLRPLYESGELAATSGIGPATLGVLAELLEQGESAYLERLLEAVPEGLVEMARVPGLTPPKVRLIHDTLGVSTLDELEEAVTKGRLEGVRGFGPKTVARVAAGITTVRESQGLALLPHAVIEAVRLAATAGRHPDVTRTDVAGDVRRAMEVVGPLSVVAGCTTDPSRIARELAALPAVRDAEFPAPRVARIHFVDGTRLRIATAGAEQYPVTLWRATGSARHVEQVLAHAATLGMDVGDDDRLVDRAGAPVPVASEEEFYAALGLDWIAPELREGTGEVEAAAMHTLPHLIEPTDITGALHCHSTYSDGAASIAEMADAARERGWTYIGITDHSVSASYAGGLTRAAVFRQHAEIDQLNAAATDGFRILKGIECDILADGALDYDDELLAQFDYVVGSVHSRFSMDGDTMTRRILAALEHPRLTILAHPTGRLLLSRAPYAVNLDAVIDKAAETGTVLELNADPHRLDLDWRWCRVARERGVLLEIGPDAHSTRGLDNVWLGVRLARKAWLGARDVLNTRSADEILAIAERAD